MKFKELKPIVECLNNCSAFYFFEIRKSFQYFVEKQTDIFHEILTKNHKILKKLIINWPKLGKKISISNKKNGSPTKSRISKPRTLKIPTYSESRKKKT
jgi:hypothetical protein